MFGYVDIKKKLFHEGLGVNGKTITVTVFLVLLYMCLFQALS